MPVKILAGNDLFVAGSSMWISMASAGKRSQLLELSKHKCIWRIILRRNTISKIKFLESNSKRRCHTNILVPRAKRKHRNPISGNWGDGDNSEPLTQTSRHNEKIKVRPELPGQKRWTKSAKFTYIDALKGFHCAITSNWNKRDFILRACTLMRWSITASWSVNVIKTVSDITSR